eukprot:TRINITY_DN2357_c0_g1_i1.p1 TRINITY_DN2357_c0_g1~~TRINITY_DN2357_c0_g1_i1.p1  ORF type:complete len:305 (-),score=59.75 TRINITY_DN2357_c0_g1_i1:481-1395(-)
MNTRSFSSPTLRTSSTGSQARADRIWHVCCLVVVAACTIAYVGATRRAVETFPLPVALAALQLCVGLAWSLALSLFGVRKPFPKLGSAEVRLVMPATLLHAAAAAATAAALRYTPPLSFLALLGAEAGSHSVAAALLPSTAGAAAAVACAAIAALAAHFGCGVPAAPALLGAAAYALSASRHAAAGALYAGPSVTLRRLSGSSCHSLVAAAAALVLVPFACVWDWYSMVLWLGNGEGAKAGELAALLVAGGVAKAAMDEASHITFSCVQRQTAINALVAVELVSCLSVHGQLLQEACGFGAMRS